MLYYAFYTVYYKVVGDDNHEDYIGESSVNISIAKAAQAAPTTAAAVAETVSGKADGKITGVDATMQYKSATGEYTAITGTEVTGLATGDYQVRYVETDNYLASDPVTVTITTGDKLTVTFDSDGGTAVDAQELDYNGTATEPAAPTKTGYTFKEWQLDEAAYDFNTAVTANITLKASYTVNQYTITFDTGGGSTITAITQDYGTAITVPAAPTKTGYTFTGWNPAIPATMPAENLTVYAQWNSNTPTYNPTYIVTTATTTTTTEADVTPIDDDTDSDDDTTKPADTDDDAGSDDTTNSADNDNNDTGGNTDSSTTNSADNNNNDTGGMINLTDMLSVANCEMNLGNTGTLIQAEEILKQELPKIKKDIPDIQEGPFYIGVSNNGGNGVTMNFVAKCTEGSKYRVERALKRDLILLFNEKGL